MTLRLSQCVVQELVEQDAVGQAGQEIEVGELADLLLRSSARNELTNLQAYGLSHAKESCIRLADVPNEELEHATELIPYPDRQCECSVQAGLGRDGSTQKTGVAGNVGDTNGLAGRPYAPDQSCWHRRKTLLLAAYDKLPDLADVDAPRVGAAQQAVSLIPSPIGSAIPAEVLADHFDDLRHGIINGVGFGHYASYIVFQRLTVLELLALVDIHERAAQ